MASSLDIFLDRVLVQRSVSKLDVAFDDKILLLMMFNDLLMVHIIVLFGRFLVVLAVVFVIEVLNVFHRFLIVYWSRSTLGVRMLR